MRRGWGVHRPRQLNNTLPNICGTVRKAESRGLASACQKPTPAGESLLDLLIDLRNDHSGSSSSGMPAREVRREATAARAAVLATTRQSTDSMVAAAGSKATAVWAKVRIARTAAALNQSDQLRIVEPTFSGEVGPRAVVDYRLYSILRRVRAEGEMLQLLLNA